LVALLEDLAQPVGQAGQDRLGRSGARHGDGLFVKGGDDGLDEPCPSGALGWPRPR
jgi:hypothetical protein